MEGFDFDDDDLAPAVVQPPITQPTLPPVTIKTSPYFGTAYPADPTIQIFMKEMTMNANGFFTVMWHALTRNGVDPFYRDTWLQDIYNSKSHYYRSKMRRDIVDIPKKIERIRMSLESAETDVPIEFLQHELAAYQADLEYIAQTSAMTEREQNDKFFRMTERNFSSSPICDFGDELDDFDFFRPYFNELKVTKRQIVFYEAHPKENGRFAFDRSKQPIARIGNVTHEPIYIGVWVKKTVLDVADVSDVADVADVADVEAGEEYFEENLCFFEICPPTVEEIEADDRRLRTLLDMDNRMFYGETADCPFLSESITSGYEARCGHRMSVEGVIEWLRTGKDKCPICRASMI